MVYGMEGIFKLLISEQKTAIAGIQANEARFLSLPLNCTDSIRRWKMNSFRSSLDRTGLGAPLDITQNVTCFTPNDQAFLSAGSPNVTANITELSNLIKFHIITEPLYSNFLEDGQTFTTYSNETIRITIRDGDIYVNDAKIINKNVMYVAKYCKCHISDS